MYSIINGIYISKRNSQNLNPIFSLLTVSDLFRVGFDKKLKDNETYYPYTITFIVASCLLMIVTDLSFPFVFFTNSAINFQMYDIVKKLLLISSYLITLSWIITACITVHYEGFIPHIIFASMLFVLSHIQRVLFLSKGYNVNNVSKNIYERLVLSKIAMIFMIYYFLLPLKKARNTESEESATIIPPDLINATTIFSLCELIMLILLIWDRVDVINYIIKFFSDVLLPSINDVINKTGSFTESNPSYAETAKNTTSSLFQKIYESCNPCQS